MRTPRLWGSEQLACGHRVTAGEGNGDSDRASLRCGPLRRRQGHPGWRQRPHCVWGVLVWVPSKETRRQAHDVFLLVLCPLHFPTNSEISKPVPVQGGLPGKTHGWCLSFHLMSLFSLLWGQRTLMAMAYSLDIARTCKMVTSFHHPCLVY